jgi:hypothetical protein
MSRLYPTGEPIDSPDPDAGKFLTVTQEGYVEPRLGLSLAEAIEELVKQAYSEAFDRGFIKGFEQGLNA